jgi:YHS domain-containing protein
MEGSKMKGMKDPVCGMMAKEEFSYEYKGKTFYFDSDFCRNKFISSPESYLRYTKLPPELKGRVTRELAFFFLTLRRPFFPPHP